MQHSVWHKLVLRVVEILAVDGSFSGFVDVTSVVKAADVDGTNSTLTGWVREMAA